MYSIYSKNTYKDVVESKLKLLFKQYGYVDFYVELLTEYELDNMSHGESLSTKGEELGMSVYERYPLYETQITDFSEIEFFIDEKMKAETMEKYGDLAERIDSDGISDLEHINHQYNIRIHDEVIEIVKGEFIVLSGRNFLEISHRFNSVVYRFQI